MTRRPHVLLVAAALGALLVSMPGAQAYTRPARTQVVSSYPNGKPANDFSSAFDPPVMTPNGRYVAFTSIASNLVPDDLNGAYDVFRKDLVTGRVTLVSAGLDGRPGVGSCPVAPWYSSLYPSISDDGRYVSFTSCASNLVAGDLNLERDVFVRDLKLGKTVIASATPNGTPPLPSLAGISKSGSQSLSANGRYVVFDSYNDTLVPGDTNTSSDVFVRDLVRNTTKRVSVGPRGQQANSTSQACVITAGGQSVISANGRFVAFASLASNLVSSDTNEDYDVFVRDLQRGTNEIVSVNDHGEQGTSFGPTGCPSTSAWPSISGNGRYVSFLSVATNLVPSNDIDHVNVFVRDRTTRKTTRVDVLSSGESGEYADRTQEAIARASGLSGSMTHAISRDGRYVAIYTALQLTPEAGKFDQTYLHDRVTGTTELISVRPDGTPGTSGLFVYLVDGRRIGFSGRSSMAPGDKADIHTAMIRHRGAALGTTKSVGSTMTIAAGSNNGVAEASDPANDSRAQPAGTAADITGARVVYRPSLDDLYVRIDVAVLDPVAAASTSYAARLRTDQGVFEVRSLPAATLGAAALGEPPFQLLSCTVACTPVAPVHGGIGTIGSSVTFAVPLDALGLDNGGRITELTVRASALTPVTAEDTLTVIGR